MCNKIDIKFSYINIRTIPRLTRITMRFRIFFVLWTFAHNIEAFPPMYKFVRVNCKIMKREAARTILPKMNSIVEDESSLIERSVSILSDNAVNEMLYLLKFYHMTNDTSSSFLYILSYELIWVAYQLHKKNMLSKNAFDISNEDSHKLLKQLMLNVTLYILLKNLVINNVISEINKDYIIK